MAPLAVRFTDTSTGTGITAWRWAYRNATIGWTQFATAQSPEYLFASGIYDINLTVTNAGGSDDEIRAGFITVSEISETPVAGFSATPLSGIPPLLVTFTDTSTPTPTSWRWAYRNSTIGWTEFATTQNPSFMFAAGTYDINLTATNVAGSDDEIRTGYIAVTASPYIDISISGSIDNWNFKTGTNEDTTSVDMTVDTNMNQWSVGAMDAMTESKPVGTAGKMAEWSGSTYTISGKALANAVEVKAGTGSYYTLSGTNQPVQAGTARGVTSYDIGMKQLVADTDPALAGDHRYRIVVTFTGAAA
jgi:PKD repeat protein